MLNQYFNAWKRPFDFKGRSNRQEYWYFNLLSISLSFFINLLRYFLTSLSSSLLYNSGNLEFIATFFLVIVNTLKIFSFLLFFGFIWTSIPLTVRRIRDVGMRWQWIFLSLIPYIGNVFALIFLTRTSIDTFDNKVYFQKYPDKIRDIWIITFAGIILFLIILFLAVSSISPSG